MNQETIKKLQRIQELTQELEELLGGGLEAQEEETDDEEVELEPIRAGKRRRLTPEVRERIEKMLENGLGATDIEKKTGLSKPTIYRIKSEMGKQGPKEEDESGEEEEGGFRKL